jgi:hypothetical protein
MLWTCEERRGEMVEVEKMDKWSDGETGEWSMTGERKEEYYRNVFAQQYETVQNYLKRYTTTQVINLVCTTSADSSVRMYSPSMFYIMEE